MEPQIKHLLRDTQIPRLAAEIFIKKLVDRDKKAKHLMQSLEDN